MLKSVAVIVSSLLFFKIQLLFLPKSDLTPIIESLALVLFGPLLSISLAYPLATIRKLLAEIFTGPARDNRAITIQIRDLAKVWQRAGGKTLEEVNKKTRNPFLKKGIEMVIDGYSPGDIERILGKNYDMYLSRREAQANILSSLSKLTQSFGFIGTVIGLISVLGSLQDKAHIGTGVSMALFTTLYGLLLANFLYIPLHKKFIERARKEYDDFGILVEGVLGIARGESSKHIYYKLSSCFTAEKRGAERELPQAASLAYQKRFSFLG